MSQADGYVRIVTQNDVSEAQRSTEQLGDTIQEALDTTPADDMTQAVNEVQQAAEQLGEAIQDSLDTAPAEQMVEAVNDVQTAAEQLGDTMQDSMSAVSADKMTEVLLEIQRSIDQLGVTISDSSNQMVEAIGNVEEGVDDTGEAAVKTGDIIKANLLSEVITKGLEKLGDALKDAASRTLEVAGSLDSAVNKIAAATNASAEDIEKLEAVVKQIYGDNFGEDFEDIADSISKIKQNLGKLDDKELVKVTESAYALKDVFDYDIAESSRAVKAMMENFSVSASEAYDYIARGAQNGLDYSGELLDNISEYSVQFKKMGLSASDMFTIFSNGAENGAWNLDKIGDSVKEMAIRVIDGSDTSKQGFEALGFEAGSMAEKFAAGGVSARVAFQEVIAALAEMNDPIAQNTAGINLMGTMWEDMGAEAVLALGDISDSAFDCAGAMDSIKDVNYSSLNNSLENVKRQIDLLIEPIGEKLIPSINEAADTISEVAQKGDLKEIVVSVGNFVSGTLTLLLKNIKLITTAITGVTAAFIAFKTAAMITKVIQSWQTAILQVKLLGTAQEFAAVKTAAQNGQLTIQEAIYALLSGRLDAATVKQIALNTAMSLNPAGIVAAAVGILATVLTGFALSASNAADDVDELNDSTNDLNQKAKELNQTAEESDKAASEVHKLVNEYKNIKQASDNTEEAKQRLKDIQDTLIQTYGTEAEQLDLVNGKYKEQLDILNNVADKKDEVARMAANAAYFQARDIIQNGYSLDMSESGANFADDLERSLFENFLELNKIPARISEDGKKLVFQAGTSYANIEKYLTTLGSALENGVKFGGNSKLYSFLSNAATEVQKANEEYIKIQELYNQYNNILGDSRSDPSAKTPITGSPVIAAEEQKKGIKAQREFLNKRYGNGAADVDWNDFDSIRELYKYRLDMDYDTEAEYYAKLAELRDKFLEPNSEKWRSVNVEIKKYYDNLSAEQKKAYDEQVAAQKKADEEAKKAAEQAAAEAIAARKAAYSEEKSQLEFKLKTNHITEKKYYSELAKLRDKYLDKNSAEWRSAFLETYEYNQKIVQANKDALEKLLNDTSDTTLSALEKIVSARDSLTAKLTDFNKTFEKVTETIPETVAVKGDFTITTAEHDVETYKMGADSIEDNVKVLEEYGAMLDALKARGADESTLSSILNMDIEEGMEFGSKLLNMSDQAWNSYFDSLERLHKTAAEISAKYYQNEVNSLKENFVDKLRSAFDGMTSDMYQVGFDTAKAFVEGWNKQLGTEDLTLGDIAAAVSGGTLSTAPVAAQSMSAAGTVLSGATKLMSQIVNVPVYIGTQKLADVMVDVTNGKIIQTGKNVLMT